METKSLRLSWVAQETLQFGHGCDAVETRYEVKVKDDKQCGFNSATAVTPWKPYVAHELGHVVSLLQFGHGCDAVETNILATE